MRAQVSVIVPTLNSASELPRLAESLYPGLHTGLIRELIVSDGGSTDGTTEAADRIGALIVSGRTGRGQQLSEGARAAKGDWLLFLHADTVLEDGWESDVDQHVRSVPGPGSIFPAEILVPRVPCMVGGGLGQFPLEGIRPALWGPGSADIKTPL